MGKLTFESVFDAWEKLNEMLYNECEEYIKSKLELVSSKSIFFNGALTDMPSVAWDGGMPNNCSSVIERVYLRDGEIYLDTEDVCEYSIKNVTAEELYRIAVAVMKMIPYIDEG